MARVNRVNLVLKPSDYKGPQDEASLKAVKDLFAHMFGADHPNPEIPGKSSAFGTVANDPRLGLLLVKLSDYMVRELPWTSRRRKLQQLMVQTLNVHFKCDFSFQSHIAPAEAAGVTREQQALIPFWRTANAFDDEERLVIEYTFAVCSGEVPDELWDRVVAQYGEQEALELSIGVAWWSFWAMIINATRTEYDFQYGKPAAERT